jgi:hypothetical protein
MGFPVVSLFLIGFSPSFVIWGDSMRAWGCGVLFILLTFGLIWQTIESPTSLVVAATVFVSVIAVQTSYYNAVILFAICMAGFVVTAVRREWKRGALVLSIGLVAAISVTPYLGAVRTASSHHIILQSPFGIYEFARKLGGVSSTRVCRALPCGFLLSAEPWKQPQFA